MESEKISISDSYHWFYQDDGDTWTPFSFPDSAAIDHAYCGGDVRIVPTHSTRFDVDVRAGIKNPVYWSGPSHAIRRCSWFHRNSSDGPWQPYTEDIAALLEHEYLEVVASMRLRRTCKKIPLQAGEWIGIHSLSMMRHYHGDDWDEMEQSISDDVWEVKRGIDGMDISVGESRKVDHLVFVVHGIGSVCDTHLRNIVEVVDSFREITGKLLEKHLQKFQGCSEKVNRVEFLPVKWHDKLHKGETGTDAKIAPLTLPSLPMLRSFTNSTILDVLFYTSPAHCQIIQDTTASEINRLHKLYMERNPHFMGKVAFIGHSLGSVILFDLLQAQSDSSNSSNESGATSSKDINISSSKDHVSVLKIQPSHFFALGSPIPMFLSTRGVDKFILPACPRFYNIFHPYDPIAYRMEPLLNPDWALKDPVLIPHHKGRKRLHLELTEFSRTVYTGIKAILMGKKITKTTLHNSRKIAKEDVTEEEDTDTVEENTIDFKDIKGTRVDFVLQETPFESINEYLFSLSSHLTYWQSKDTSLFILKELYNK